MRPIPDYRISIYSTNFLFILLLWWLIYQISLERRFIYFGLDMSEPMIVIFVAATALQIVVCVGGVCSVFCSWRTAIRLHWLMMIPLVIMDFALIGFSTARYVELHKDMPRLLTEDSVKLGGSELCTDWQDIRADWECCPPEVVLRACRLQAPRNWTIVPPCRERKPNACALPFLRYLHSETELIRWLLIFGLLPLKLFIFFVLREDIQELFTEIVYTDNQQLYRHWADDEEDSKDSSNSHIDEHFPLNHRQQKVFGGVTSNESTIQSYHSPKRSTIIRPNLSVFILPKPSIVPPVARL